MNPQRSQTRRRIQCRVWGLMMAVGGAYREQKNQAEQLEKGSRQGREVASHGICQPGNATPLGLSGFLVISCIGSVDSPDINVARGLSWKEGNMTQLGEAGSPLIMNGAGV